MEINAFSQGQRMRYNVADLPRLNLDARKEFSWRLI